MNDEICVEALALTAFVAALLGAAGCPPDEAQAVAANLVDANLAGHDSHGVGRAPRYVEMIREGLVVPGRRIAVERDGGGFITVDGESGFGAVIGAQAVDLGCERAAANGACVVALRNASHLGRIGAWAERAAAAGYVSVHFVNVRGRSLVAPYGGIDRRMATSPMSVGIPIAGSAPIIGNSTRFLTLGTRPAHLCRRNMQCAADAFRLFDHGDLGTGTDGLDRAGHSRRARAYNRNIDR